MTSTLIFSPYWDNRLRDDQKEAVRAIDQAFRAGLRNILLCAPTGSGKTEIAACLVDMCWRKGRRSAFVVDRKSLIQQTSQTFDLHGIDHGIIQADHSRFRPGLPVQVCSVQTIGRRRQGWPDADLVIVDEAHAVNKVVVDRISSRTSYVVGLTATPFTKGLGRHYDCVINVTTTNKLIKAGHLSRYRIFACTEPDMRGVKVVAGEFERRETERRALPVVGDAVREYMLHGEEQKFICSAVDLAHVMELQRQFLAAGVNVATYTYKDLDEDRDETVAEFRRADSSIRGLITVTALSKGFNVPDIGCVIMARPLRNSLAEHIQFLGRGLRTHPGKKDCIILDHSGNCARFWDESNHHFEHGVSELDNRKKHSKPSIRKEAEDAGMTCPQCKRLHKAQPFCPDCGYEYPKRRAVEHVPGTLKELLAVGSPEAITKTLWPQICYFARERYKRKPSTNQDGGRAYALWLYFEIVGAHPQGQWFERTTPVAPSAEVRGKITSVQIRNARRQQARGARP